jgi:hypothetical protein
VFSVSGVWDVALVQTHMRLERSRDRTAVTLYRRQNTHTHTHTAHAHLVVGSSVPSCRSTRYCAGVSSCRHSPSVCTTRCARVRPRSAGSASSARSSGAQCRARRWEWLATHVEQRRQQRASCCVRRGRRAKKKQTGVQPLHAHGATSGSALPAHSRRLCARPRPPVLRLLLRPPPAPRHPAAAARGATAAAAPG